MENKSHPTRSTPVDITFRLLEEITHDFSEEQKIGHGGYGKVYKGVHNGVEIAIKKLHHMPGLDDVQFKKEFNNLMKVHHQNIVALVGYCYEVRHKHFEHNGEYSFAEMAERALCFEYLAGGSLDKHVSDASSGLDWSTRYKIINGICDGLNYLHTGSKDPIYHMDLKPGNILLNKDMTPKIGDFGLSRLFASTATFTTTNMIGTPGYMPPEYINKRKISNKFDVFSLGVIIIQIMAGPQGFSECADVATEEFIEVVHGNWGKRLHPMSWHTSQEVRTCIEIALRCVEEDRDKRPTISEIVDELKKLDSAKRSQIGQSFESGLVCAAVDPMEVRFPFSLHKEASCVLQITNRTDDPVAFSTKASRDRYHAQPAEGVLPPCSRLYIVVTMRAPETALPDMQCNDVFLVQSRRVHVSKDDDDLVVVTPDDVKDEPSRKLPIGEVVVDEARLPIVYVPLPQPPSSSH